MSNDIMSQSLLNSNKKDKLQSTTTHQLHDAINNAVTFLLEARDQQGWWRDYYFRSFGSGNEWITGYVGSILATVPNARVKEAIINAWELLKTTYRPPGGWGYYETGLVDSSSTIWVIQLAEAVGAGNSEQVQQAKKFVATCQLSNGGIKTYENDEGVRDFFKVPPHLGTEGYVQTHTCVTAETAALPEYSFRVRDYLKATQTFQGNWQGYWWIDDEYTTALAAEGLAACGQAVDQPCIDKAIAWAVKRLSPQGCVQTIFYPNGSPFATAWCLRLLLLNTVDPEVKAARAAAMQWLLEQQCSNGAWTSSAIMQVAYPWDLNPYQIAHWTIIDGEKSRTIVLPPRDLDPGKIPQSTTIDEKPRLIFFDQNSIHTTATVLSSLQKVAELLEE